MKNLSLVFLFIVVFILKTSTGCIMFTASQNGKTLIGNNEDWKDYNTRMWFAPASEGIYGRVYFGFGDGD